MTPEEIIEALKEYFKGRMDEEVRLEDLGFAFSGTDNNKESLLTELSYYGL